MSSLPADPHQPVFKQERTRLVAALGAVTDGGVIWDIQPIGSSSVPGLAGSGRVDIGLYVWPFPVDPARLAELGYAPLDPLESGTVQRFEDTSGQIQLWLASAEDAFFENAVLIRDYLRHSELARNDFLANRAEKASFFARTLKDAQQWWVAYHGFAPLETITGEFTGKSWSQPAMFPWFVSSGWALDLFLGRVTRVHRDVDIVVPFSHQSALQAHLLERGWRLLTPLDGRLEPWPLHMQIQMPRHQIHAHRDGEFIDLLLTDIDKGVWRYRRDPAVIRNVERISLISEAGIPYLAPELVLLFKSKNTSKVERPQDQVDFEQALPLLDPERRAWLRWAITASDPDNRWLKDL